MKISLLFLAFIFTISPQAIDKNISNKVNKEISKVFNIKDFSLKAISNKSTKDINGDFFMINAKLTIGYCYIGKVYTCRGHNANKKDAEFFEYFILFDANKKIKKIKIFNYEASYGQEICNKSWLKQFVGYDGNKQIRIGNEIDAISGATLSSDNIVKDINNVNKILKGL